MPFTIHTNLAEAMPRPSPFWRGILQVPSYALPLWLRRECIRYGFITRCAATWSWKETNCKQVSPPNQSSSAKHSLTCFTLITRPRSYFCDEVFPWFFQYLRHFHTPVLHRMQSIYENTRCNSINFMLHERIKKFESWMKMKCSKYTGV